MASSSKETKGKRNRRDAKKLVRRQRRVRLAKSKKPLLSDVLK